MYVFSYFKDSDKQRITQLMREYPFAMLMGSFVSGKQVATQIPVLCEEREGIWYLQGHMMRNTDHHKAFMENPQALIVFTGPHSYVSASWYSNARIGSTWNYMSVHASGNIRFMDATELEVFMRKLTLTFEQGNTQSPTVYDNLPDDFLKKMMPAIVGFELRAESFDHVCKLSQNRDEASYLNIISQLEARGGDSARIAHEMRIRKAELFPPGVEWDASRFDS